MPVLGRGGESPALPGVGLSRAGVPAWFLFLVDGPFSLRQELPSSPFHPVGSPSQAVGDQPTGSASHLVGVILGYGGRLWGSQAQGSVLQKSLVSPQWDTPCPSPESPSWADFRWPVRVAAGGEGPFLQDGVLGLD